MHHNSKRITWRDFQDDYQKRRQKKHKLLSIIKPLIIAPVCIGLLIYFLSTDNPDLLLNNSNFSHTSITEHKGTGSENILPENPPKNSNVYSISTVKELIKDIKLFNNSGNTYPLTLDGNSLIVETSIDPNLQQFLLSKLDALKSLERGKPQRIAVVVMEPETGRVIAMTGFDLDDPDYNPCVESIYPAASIFKIVTASAAVERHGYTPKTPMYFNGGKYTLYKRQLKDTKNKYTTQISFDRAFAESVNPVFGKIAANQLGGQELSRYAEAFGFGQDLESDFYFESGSILITEKSYQWAEVGSGFNTTTRISPVFSAMIAATVVNGGKMPFPTVIETIHNSGDGNMLYQRQAPVFKQVITPETAKTMMDLMAKTITSGTARKCFRGTRRNATLEKLDMGGKTGSLYNEDNTVKYDWFAGFAKEKNGAKQLAISVIVGHRNYIGTRAPTYGKWVFETFFKNYFAAADSKSNKG